MAWPPRMLGLFLLVDGIDNGRQPSLHLPGGRQCFCVNALLPFIVYTHDPVGGITASYTANHAAPLPAERVDTLRNTTVPVCPLPNAIYWLAIQSHICSTGCRPIMLAHLPQTYRSLCTRRIRRSDNTDLRSSWNLSITSPTLHAYANGRSHSHFLLDFPSGRSAIPYPAPDDQYDGAVRRAAMLVQSQPGNTLVRTSCRDGALQTFSKR